MTAQLSGYRQWARQVIDWTRSNDSTAWQPTNLNAVNSIGVEASVDVRFAALLGNDFFVKRFYVGYHYITADLVTTTDVLSRYALEHLNNQLSLNVEHRIFKKLHHSAHLRFVDRVTMENYWVLDAKVFWKAKNYTVFVEGSNLLDTVYRETNLVQMPGRWLRGGFVFSY